MQFTLDIPSFLAKADYKPMLVFEDFVRQRLYFVRQRLSAISLDLLASGRLEQFTEHSLSLQAPHCASLLKGFLCREDEQQAAKADNY